MSEWITAHIGDIIVSLIILLVVALSVCSIIKRRKSGKGSCGCGCGNCPVNADCHKKSAEG